MEDTSSSTTFTPDLKPLYEKLEILLRSALSNCTTAGLWADQRWREAIKELKELKDNIPLPIGDMNETEAALFRLWVQKQ